MSDILDDYREWQADRQRWARVRTHSDRCHMYHDECMVVRMAAEITRLRSEVERLRAVATNHDAAPAARAAELARSPGQSPRGTGDTTWEPLCWCCSGPGIQSFHESKADAEEYREHSGIADEVEVFQVGRAFALTDAEREALEAFAFDRPMDRATAAQTAATLRALFARLGGVL